VKRRPGRCPSSIEVEIVYSTTDRYVGESLEPDEEYAEDVRGVVNSVVLREEGDEVRGKGAGQARPLTVHLTAGNVADVPAARR